MRTLPHQDEAYVRRELDRILDGIDGVSYQLAYTAVPSMSPYGTDFVAALQRAGEIALDRDDIVWLPGLTTGFTDSRLVRPLGIAAYGFSIDPPVDPDFPSGVHGVNESILVEALLLKTRFLVALAWDVLG